MNEPDLFDPFKRLRKLEGNLSKFWDDSLFSETGLRQSVVDVLDKGKQLEILAELPGVEKKDIDLSVEPHSIIIKAKTGFEAKEKKEKEGYFFHERRNSSFFRRIPLPTEIMPEKADAEFKNGILTIILPKKHPSGKHSGKKVMVK